MMRQICLILYLLLLTSCASTMQTANTPSTTTTATAGTTGPTTTLASNNSQSGVAPLPNDIGPLKSGGTPGSGIANWQVSGKIGVQTPRNSGSATINWNQRGANYTISIQGPIGTPGMNLAGTNGKVVLQTSDGKKYSASSPEQLLAEHWGYQLPVSNLYYWIQGKPVPSIPAKTSYDGSHRLSNLVQQGWAIQYLAYSQIGNRSLPTKISAYSSTLRVKMVIYNWRI